MTYIKHQKFLIFPYYFISQDLAKPSLKVTKICTKLTSHTHGHITFTYTVNLKQFTITNIIN